MTFLATVWILMIQPNNDALRPDGKPVLGGQLSTQFVAEQVQFDNIQDCDAYARQHMGDLLKQKKRKGVPVNFPAGTTATYTCLSEAR